MKHLKLYALALGALYLVGCEAATTITRYKSSAATKRESATEAEKESEPIPEKVIIIKPQEVFSSPSTASSNSLLGTLFENYGGVINAAKGRFANATIQCTSGEYIHSLSLDIQPHRRFAKIDTHGLRSYQSSPNNGFLRFEVDAVYDDAPELFDDIYSTLLGSAPKEIDHAHIAYRRSPTRWLQGEPPMKCTNYGNALLEAFEEMVLEIDIHERAPTGYSSLMWNDWQESVGRNASYEHGCVDSQGFSPSLQQVVLEQSCDDYNN